MERKLGLTSVILLGVNMVFGSGIYLLPGQVMALVGGSWSLVVYIFVSLIALAIAWCFAECAALFSRNGGAYLYAKEAFGNFVGFEIGMMRWAVGSIAWAALAVGFVTILSSLVPEAAGEPLRSILIITLIGGLGIANMLNVGMITSLNNIITITKLLPLFLFVFAGMSYVDGTDILPQNLAGFDMQPFGTASLIVFYAFGGFEALVVAAGEMKNPKKNLPIALMATIVICATAYFFIQLVAVGALGDKLATSVNPIADIAELFFGPYGKIGVTIAMLISIGGVNIAAAFIAPKIGTALAEDNMIPQKIAEKNRFGMPYIAISITVLATTLMALTGSFTELVVVSAVSRFAQHISTCLAVLVLYKHRFSLKKPQLQVLLMIVPIIGLGGIGWLLLQTPLFQLVYGFAALILGIPLYFFWKRKEVLVEEI